MRLSFPVKKVTKTIKVEDLKDGGSFKIGAVVVRVSKAEHTEGKFEFHYRVEGKARGRPRFVLLDERGNTISTNGRSSSSSGDRVESSWYLRRGAQVHSVQVTGYLGHKTFEVPFDFTDVPLPKGEDE